MYAPRSAGPGTAEINADVEAIRPPSTTANAQLPATTIHSGVTPSRVYQSVQMAPTAVESAKTLNLPTVSASRPSRGPPTRPTMPLAM